MSIPTRQPVAAPPPTPEPEPEKPPPKKSYITRNFLLRSLTALTLLPLVLGAIILGGVVWALLVAAIVVLATLEFHNLARGTAYGGGAWIGVPVALAIAFAFYLERLALVPLLIGLAALAALVGGWLLPAVPARQGLKFVAMTLAGVFYVALPGGFLIAIRGQDDGLLWEMVVVLITWGTDTFAYLGGRKWGRRKLAPRLSPNKTVEGALSGVVGGFVLALLFLAAAGQLSAAALVMIALGPLVAILGDLIESALKRAFAMKDSHLPGLNIVPGHGGVLDRIDALLVVTAYVYVFLHVSGLAG